MSKTIHIPINRARLKLTGVLYAILALVSIALFFLVGDYLGGNWTIALKIVGGLLGLLFVLTGSGALKLLGDKSAGLIIDHTGIHDKSSSIGVGFVSWKSIREIEPRVKEKLVLVHVKKNEDILDAASNKAIRQLLQKNVSIYKTPVILESKYLQCSFDELVSSLNRESKK